MTAPARISRRRIVVTVALVAVAAVVAGEVAADVVAADAKAGRASARTYVAALMPLVDESNALAPLLQEIRGQAVSLGRPGLEAALGRLVAGAAQVETQLSTLGLAAPSSRSAALIATVMSDRSAGARILTGGVALAIGPSSSGTQGGGNGVAPTGLSADNAARATAASLITKAGRQFEEADVAYGEFVSSLPAASWSRRLPSSTWLRLPVAWGPAAAAVWVGNLASASELAVHHALVIIALSEQPPAVRVTGIPPPTTSTTTSPTTTTTTTSTTTTTVPGQTTSSTTTSTSTTTTTSTSTTTTTLQLPPAQSVSVLAPTRGILAVLVVANAGNVTESNVWAVASLQPVAGSFPKGTPEPPIRFVAQRIGTLAPGGSVALTLPRLEAVPDGGYTLAVSVGVGPLPKGPVNSSGGIGQTETVHLTVAAE